MYAVQKDVWHLTESEKHIVEQLLKWSNNLFNVGTYESRQRYFKDRGAVKYPNLKAKVQSEHARHKLPQGFSSQRLQQLSETRARRMRDAVNKAVRTIVNYCQDNRINVIVFGWNKGQKQEANMGKVTNQNFVQIPTAKVKERLQQECDLRGWRFVEQEESYTSKSSFLDRDVVPVKVGEKLDNWQPSGKRIKRGLYRSAQGLILNADMNGAANIIRKSCISRGLIN